MTSFSLSTPQNVPCYADEILLHYTAVIDWWGTIHVCGALIDDGKRVRLLLFLSFDLSSLPLNDLNAEASPSPQFAASVECDEMIVERFFIIQQFDINLTQFNKKK